MPPVRRSEVSLPPGARSAVEELAERVRTGEVPVLLVGADAAVKTEVLWELARRLESEFYLVHSSCAPLSPTELAVWILGGAGEVQPDESEERLVAVATSLGREGRRLLLLIDTADDIRTDTARALLRWVVLSRGALRVVVVWNLETWQQRRDALAGAFDCVKLDDTAAVATEAHIPAVLLTKESPPPAISRRPLRRLTPSPPRREITQIALLVALVAIAIPTLRNWFEFMTADSRQPTAVQKVRPRSAAARAERSQSAAVQLPPAAKAPPSPTLSLQPQPPSAPVLAPAANVQRPSVSPSLLSRPASELVAVNLNATPWATIAVDGNVVGETPLAGIELTPGPHRFTATFPDGRRVERTLEISRSNRHLSFE